MKELWTQIESLGKFADQKLAEMKKSGQSDAWFSFDETTDVHIEEMDDSPLKTFQAIAYPVDENGNTITDENYIQLF